MIYTILLLASLFSVSIIHSTLLRVENLTSHDIEIATTNFPFRRSDVPRVHLTRLKPRQSAHFAKNNPLLCWYQKGVDTGYTVIDMYDTCIYIIFNNGALKTLHGDLRTIKVKNSRYYSVTARTKNPNAGEIDCSSCAEECYANDRTLEYCNCLDYCADKSQDLAWYLAPYASRSVTVAAGTKLGIYKPSHSNDDEDEQVTITHTTIYDIYE